MTEKEFADKFERVLMLLGIGTSIILNKRPTEEDKQWWMKAIQAVVYENKPIPEMFKRKK